MAITLTENAARQIQSQLAKRGKGLALRIGVKKVGCSGLAHTFDYADEVRAGDHTFESHNAKVVVDANSLSFLARFTRGNITQSNAGILLSATLRRH